MNKKQNYKVAIIYHLLYNKVYRGNIYSLTLGADGGVKLSQNNEKRHISLANLVTMKKRHISDIKLQLDC